MWPWSSQLFTFCSMLSPQRSLISNVFGQTITPHRPSHSCLHARIHYPSAKRRVSYNIVVCINQDGSQMRYTAYDSNNSQWNEFRVFWNFTGNCKYLRVWNHRLFHSWPQLSNSLRVVCNWEIMDGCMMYLPIYEHQIAMHRTIFSMPKTSVMSESDRNIE